MSRCRGQRYNRKKFRPKADPPQAEKIKMEEQGIKKMWGFIQQHFFQRKSAAGFTLIELMIALSIFVIIAGVAIVSINPVSQFSKARNSQRELHLEALMNAIRQNIADSAVGKFTCSAGGVPTTTKKMAIGAGNYDIAGCLVPIYLPTMPFDPSTSTAHYTANSNYDTGYTIAQATSTGAITISAPASELKKTISITR